MKKSLQILIMFAFIGLSAQAQSWATAGATWYYNFGNSWTDFGYHEIQKTSDTLINGKACDNLLSTFHGYDYFQSQFFTSQSRNYTYINNDTLYYLYHNQFVIMAVFSAQVGDKWKIPFDTAECNNVDSAYFNVDSLGQIVFSGDTLPVLYLTSYQNNSAVNSCFLTKKMGFNLFMFDSLECILDQDVDYGIRCYYDSSGYSYNSGIVLQCDSTVGIENISVPNNSINIFPNPNSGTFTLHQSGITNFKLEIIDVYGRTVYSQQFNGAKENETLTLSLSSGIYFFEMLNEGSIIDNGKLVIIPH